MQVSQIRAFGAATVNLQTMIADGEVIAPGDLLLQIFDAIVLELDNGAA
jgi:hypothetical protein